jgi:hypothetical protein
VLLRKSQVAEVIGPRLLVRMLKAKWLTPDPSSTGSAIFFDSYAVHLAMRRLQHGEGATTLSGNTRPRPGLRRNAETDELEITLSPKDFAQPKRERPLDLPGLDIDALRAELDNLP